MEPSTGRVIAMYSSPSFNPTHVDQNFARLNRVGGAPLLNRVTQGLYAPGSTFKVVTATAALQAGTTTTIDAMGHCIIDQGQQLCNAGTESYGFIDLKTALTFSVNTYFAQLGQKVGQTKLEDTMRKFGFFQLPQFTYPTDEMNPSGLYSHGRLLGTNAPVDTGRLAIGQERLLVTPLQMVEIAATVGNGGVRMAPSLVDKVETPSGHTAYTGNPQVVERVMSTATASELAADMQNVVDEGTGTSRPLAERPFDRREDRNGRDRDDRSQHRLVHRLRSCRASQDRRGGRRGAHSGLRRPDFGAHRRQGDRGVPRRRRGKVAAS